ncbi:hypothetical protein PF005_g8796 [Phytophthora fragariae]|uniref:DUF659 domain-containing protein n=1 Tax=Phytophthora fragariae TaxID=53985 RepID=A0A6A3YE72_9STRA|nr:hypothetical protein PF003_g12127 [Phytophthora fragariae]KAE8940416.1 hypothetical protein PF009_g9771 [Phytophthora fragariae]KAE9013171.1 hypothetical protein PF011_g8594 [Phytophthora fragariae]KAE9076489.1 hypothetical protein PF007_g24609 [Phytophthora fragariae]KAE9118713.1 hypothetical protein PF010_g8115 [Phytophthora fragariae]
MDLFGFVDEVTINIYQWMRWIIQRNLPITKVENKLTREEVTMKPTTARTIKVCMRYAAGKVGRVISSEMGESFYLIFDGWTSNSLYFPGIFAVYVLKGGASDYFPSLRWTTAKRCPLTSTTSRRS